MAKSFIDKWVGESTDEHREFAQEEFILEVTEAIWSALENRDWNKSQLANALSKSKAHVTQLLNGNRNMTLRTLSDIAFALEQKPRFSFVSPSQQPNWKDISFIIRTQKSSTTDNVTDLGTNKWSNTIKLDAA